MQVSVIRPGSLVSLKTTIRGGVSYARRDVVPVHAEGAAEVSTWETTRQVADAEEHRAAVEVRGRCRTLIVRHCAQSSFGLLCPMTNESALQSAIIEAQQLADEFNRGATYSRIEVFALLGRIADNDLQAARAIGAEVRDLVAAMERGIKAADPEAIREAANKARQLSGMLDPAVSGAVSDAIKAARSAAREIVRRVEKDGERAADVVAGLQLEALDRARFAVLDIEPATVDSEAAEPSAAADARALDLFGNDSDASADDSAEPMPAPIVAPVPALEFDAIGG